MAKGKDLVIGLPIVRRKEDTEEWQVCLPPDSYRIAPPTQVETVEDSRREPQIAFHVQHRRVIAALRAIGRAQEIAPRTADEQSQTVHTGLQTSVQAVAVVNEGRVTTRCTCRIADRSEIDAKGALPRPTIIGDPHTFVDNADAHAIITDVGEICVLDVATA